MAADASFHSWTVGDDARVEISNDVFHEIESAAREGFVRFRHGGMEVGGILLGRLRGNVIRITGVQPMEIGYGRGASFLLTDSEHATLASMIASANKEAGRNGMRVVGWYHSHTRRDVALADTDFEVYDRHFSDSRQVCLVVKPERENAIASALYIRDDTGQVYLAEFEGIVAGDAWHAAPPPPVSVPVAARTPPPAKPATVIPAAAAPIPVAASALAPAPKRWWAHWKYATVAILLIAATAYFWNSRRQSTRARTAAPASSLTTEHAPAKPLLPAASPTPVEPVTATAASAETPKVKKAPTKRKASSRRQRSRRTSR